MTVDPGAAERRGAAGILLVRRDGVARMGFIDWPAGVQFRHAGWYREDVGLWSESLDGPETLEHAPMPGIWEPLFVVEQPPVGVVAGSDGEAAAVDVEQRGENIELVGPCLLGRTYDLPADRLPIKERLGRPRDHSRSLTRAGLAVQMPGATR